MSNPNEYQRDIDDVLTNALETGILSEEWDAHNFMANWEYVFTIGPVDYFRHVSSKIELASPILRR